VRRWPFNDERVAHSRARLAATTNASRPRRRSVGYAHRARRTAAR
jgi:hypothetical protein